MATVLVQEAASYRLDEIYRYTRDRWGDRQAETYISSLFAAFDLIESRGVISRPIPAEFGVDGFFFRHEHHVVYWRRLASGDTLLPPITELLREQRRCRLQQDAPLLLLLSNCGHLLLGRLPTRIREVAAEFQDFLGLQPHEFEEHL